MKSALMIISACLVILLLPATLLAINQFRTVDWWEPYDIDTGANPYTDITLTQELFKGKTYNVTVVSDNELDAPIPFSYNKTSRVLRVTGLKTNDSRRLELTYKIDNLQDYLGAGIGAAVWPIFLVLGVIGIIAGAVYNAMRRGE